MSDHAGYRRVSRIYQPAPTGCANTALCEDSAMQGQLDSPHIDHIVYRIFQENENIVYTTQRCSHWLSVAACRPEELTSQAFFG